MAPLYIYMFHMIFPVIPKILDLTVHLLPYTNEAVFYYDEIIKPAHPFISHKIIILNQNQTVSLQELHTTLEHTTLEHKKEILMELFKKAPEIISSNNGTTRPPAFEIIQDHILINNQQQAIHIIINNQGGITFIPAIQIPQALQAVQLHFRYH